MLSEVCHAYGWTLDYVLNMPASQFYCMHREARFLRNRQLVDLCDIAKIPQCDFKYADGLRALYANAALGIYEKVEERVAVPEHIATQNKPLTGEDARAAMVAFFTGAKRGHSG